MKISSSPPQATTAGYLDLVGSEVQEQYARTFSYMLQCTIQDSKYKIMVSNDGTNWEILGNEESISAGVQKKVSGDLLFQYVKIMIIRDVAGGLIAGQGIVK